MKWVVSFVFLFLFTFSLSAQNEHIGDTVIIGDKSYFISKTHSLDHTKETQIQSCIIFHANSDTIFASLYAHLNQLHFTVLTESPIFHSLNTEEELREIVLSCFNEESLKLLAKQKVRIEIAVLLNHCCQAIEVCQAIESPFVLTSETLNWNEFAYLEQVLKKRLRYKVIDNVRESFEKSGIPYGTSRFIVGFNEEGVRILMQPH